MLNCVFGSMPFAFVKASDWPSGETQYPRGLTERATRLTVPVTASIRARSADSALSQAAETKSAESCFLFVSGARELKTKTAGACEALAAALGEGPSIKSNDCFKLK